MANALQLVQSCTKLLICAFYLHQYLVTSWHKIAMSPYWAWGPEPTDHQPRDSHDERPAMWILITFGVCLNSIFNKQPSPVVSHALTAIRRRYNGPLKSPTNQWILLMLLSLNYTPRNIQRVCALLYIVLCFGTGPVYPYPSGLHPLHCLRVILRWPRNQWCNPEGYGWMKHIS